MLYASIDKAGVNSIIGGMASSVVILPETFNIEDLSMDITKLNEVQLKTIANKIKRNAIYYKIFSLTSEEVDKLGIPHAIRKLLKNSVKDVLKMLKENPLTIDKIIVESSNKITELEKQNEVSFEYVEKGYLKYKSLIASTILAKDYLNDILKNISFIYPQYDIKTNKGTLTKEHIELINKYGYTNFHRKNIISKYKEQEDSYKYAQLEEVQVCIQEIADMYQSYPSIFEIFDITLLREHYKSIILEGEKPSEKIQSFIFKTNKRIKSNIYKIFHKRIKQQIGSFNNLSVKINALGISSDEKILSNRDMYELTRKYQIFINQKKTIVQ